MGSAARSAERRRARARPSARRGRRCRARRAVVPRVSRRAADRRRTVHSGARRPAARIPVRAARRLANRRSPRGRARLHGGRRRAPRPRRRRRGHGLDREPPLPRGPASGSVAPRRAAARLRRRPMKRSFLVGGAAAVAVAAAAVLWLVWPDLREPSRIEVTEIDESPEGIARGEYLARAGNCIGCHTRRGGEPYAGQRAVSTPFGEIYSTNL